MDWESYFEAAEQVMSGKMKSLREIWRRMTMNTKH